MKTYLLLLILALVCQTTSAQLSWQYLPNTPFETDRYEDVYFVNDSVGWACSVASGIIATKDGGQSWVVQNDISSCRSIRFLNDKIGFAGVFLENSFLKTTDGGNHWIDIANLLPSQNKNICGMFPMSGSTIYAVGVFWGPASIYKSTDTGDTWSYEDMDSLASGLVECKFLDSLTGFVSGRANDSIGDGVILKTTDGGDTWKKVFQSNRSEEYCWKMQFLNDSLGYASIQTTSSQVDSSFIAKTTDGGNTWKKMLVCTPNIDMEGMGFLNDTVGWVGGYSVGMFQTTDGGNTWSYLNFGENLNRIIYMSPTLLYAAGSSIYRYSSIPTGIESPQKPTKLPHTLLPCQPNPFSTNTTINFEVTEPTHVFLRIINSRGNCIETLVNANYAPGNYSATWNCGDCASGEYTVIMGTSQRFLSEKVIHIQSN